MITESEKPILYYSNFCKYSQGLVQSISHTCIKDDIYYMNIDNRYTGHDNNIYIQLKEQTVVPLPTCIDSVPSLLLSDKVLIGNEIQDFIFKKLNERQNVVYDEPESFHFQSYQHNDIKSDMYSYIDQSSDELAAKGSGGLRQLYNYARYDLIDHIVTPPEDEQYEKEISLESLIEQRQKECNNIQYKSS